jgi:thiamine biosynthesis lipoprotein
MKLSRRRFIFISAAAMTVAVPPVFGEANSGDKLVTWKGNALGASAMLAISGLSKTEAKAHIVKVQDEITRLEEIFSLYRPQSVLSRLNRHGKAESAPFEFAQLLAQVGIIHNATFGAFDPTIQPLWLAYADAKGAPDLNTIEHYKKTIGWQHVNFDTDKVTFTRPDMAITLNGIAQGYITDRIADLLKSSGLKNVVVSMGEIAAIGERAPGVAWKIGIGEKQDGIAEEFLALSNASLATSASLGTVLNEKSNIGHIIDPRNLTIPLIWKRISVIHKSAAIADGLSTAFAVMNKDEITAAISKFSDTKLIAIDHNGQRFTVG